MIKLKNGREFDSYAIAANMHEAAKDMDFFDYAGQDEKSVETLENALHSFANMASYQSKDNYLAIVADTLITLFQD